MIMVTLCFVNFDNSNFDGDYNSDSKHNDDNYDDESQE